MSGSLSAEDRERLEDLFDQAADLSAAQHAAFVERECGDHPLLREKLSLLLRGLVGEDRVGARVPGAPLPAGTRIDRYELGERLGEGGMGEVYAARQLEPVVRDVALKLIKPGMDSAVVVRRFEAERQALARMAHPAVAQVFDGGLTEQGLPYFVMERVDGLPIHEHCDREALSTRARLQLFLEVCAGVQHAHQKGVIHRDLKPSNLMVASSDGRAVPKVIDFGVARATTGSLAEVTLHTVIGQVVGTLDYMSPEQADPGGEDIDTRSDVYSLGVVLYQLVSGLLPFDHGSIEGRPLSDVQRAIREVDPPSPSTRLRRQTGTAVSVAPRHSTDQHSLIRQLSGDLDWICLKALEKDPARRYQSAAELADDLRRHLNHQPVLARRPRMLYVLSKAARRHRVGVLLGCLATLALAGLAYGVVRSIVGAEVERAFLVLSQLQRAEELTAKADELWPAYPDRIPEIDIWSQEVEEMFARLGQYRGELLALQAKALPWSDEDRLLDARAQAELGETARERSPRRTYRFDSRADENRCRWMAELVEAVEALGDPRTGLQSAEGCSLEHGWSVPWRKVEAERLAEMERSQKFAEAWSEAREAIKVHPDYGFDLTPQRGLLPLGVDERSGLWEFAHLQSGEPAWRDEDGLLELSEGTGIVLVLIPRGGFQMGAAQNEWSPPLALKPLTLEHLKRPDPNESDNEGSTLEVPDVPPFFLSKYEMTRGQWERATDMQPWEKRGPDFSECPVPPLLPADWVSWTDCSRVTRRLGLTLPTEAQWEYAARAGTTTRWWTGNDEASLWARDLDKGFRESAANLFDLSSDEKYSLWKLRLQHFPADGDDSFIKIRRIGLGARNSFGLHDVHGNVAEWCLDPPYRYGDDSPLDHSRDDRVSRGGNSRDPAYRLRSSARRNGTKGLRGAAYGLRPSRELDD